MYYWNAEAAKHLKKSETSRKSIANSQTPSPLLHFNTVD